MEILKQTSNTRVRSTHSSNEVLNFDPWASYHQPLLTAAQTEEASMDHTHSLSKQLSQSKGSQTPATVTEEVNNSSIREEISLNGAESSQGRVQTVTTEVPSAYAADTFESLDSTLTQPHQHPPVTTSTPERGDQEYGELDELSLTDSVQVTGSVTGE